MLLNCRTHASTVAIVIVTYDSSGVLERCIEAIRQQVSQPDLVVIVDNCSRNPDYLKNIPSAAPFSLVRNARNHGFCGGNNIGYQLCRGHKYVLFLNPDAFLHKDFIADAVQWMEQSENSMVGTITGTLLGFDFARGSPTNRIDSMGIFQTWYGKWYDRGQGAIWLDAPPANPQDVPAICGALMFCRVSALEDASLKSGEVFDSKFFMYKEDIDLSLRIRKSGWTLKYVPSLLCHHVRGWQGRHQMSWRSKYLSARNELRVCLRNQFKGFVYCLFKFVYVVVFELPLSRIYRRVG